MPSVPHAATDDAPTAATASTAAVSYGPQTVPHKMFGCWDRKYISFASQGHTPDTTTRVLWVQTPSGHGDMRILKARSTQGMHTSKIMTELTGSQKMELVRTSVDCSCGMCVLDETALDAHSRPKSSWTFGDTGFAQEVVSNWPEDGYLEFPQEEEGGNTCIMEYAPDGQYTEDWRLRPGSCGICCHLTSPESSSSVKRNLYLAGDHLMLAVDRSEHPKELLPLAEIIPKVQDSSLVDTYLSCEFSYATRNEAGACGCSQDFTIQLSTLPWREGCTVSIKWLDQLVATLSATKDATSEQSYQNDESSMMVKDDQGVMWKLVSIGYREL